VPPNPVIKPQIKLESIEIKNEKNFPSKIKILHLSCPSIKLFAIPTQWPYEPIKRIAKKKNT
jgi:hypothetical protein